MATLFRVLRGLCFLTAGYYSAKSKPEAYIPLILLGGAIDLLVVNKIKIVI